MEKCFGDRKTLILICVCLESELPSINSTFSPKAVGISKSCFQKVQPSFENGLNDNWCEFTCSLEQRSPNFRMSQITWRAGLEPQNFGCSRSGMRTKTGYFYQVPRRNGFSCTLRTTAWELYTLTSGTESKNIQGKLCKLLQRSSDAVILN